MIADRYDGTTLMSSTTSPIQPASARGLKFAGLVSAAKYRFRIGAINSVGASAYSAPSNLVSAY